MGSSSRKRNHAEFVSDAGSAADEASQTPSPGSLLASKFDQLHRALAEVLAVEASGSEWAAALDGDSSKVEFLHRLKGMQRDGDITWALSPPTAPAQSLDTALAIPPVASPKDPQQTSTPSGKPWPPALPPIHNDALRNQALTHTSWVDMENPHSSGLNFPSLHYQRLEFLGDSVLHYILSKHLYYHFLDNRENILSSVRTSLECNAKLAEFSRLYNLPEQTRIGRDAVKTGVNQTTKFAADVFEAYLGALALDSKDGLEVVDRFLEELMGPDLVANSKDVKSTFSQDKQAKNDLWAKIGAKGVEVKYEWTDGKGGNNGGYWYTVYLTGYGYVKKELAKGWGSNKQDAQLKAAMEALANTALIEDIRRRRAEFVPQIGNAIAKKPKTDWRAARADAKALKDTHPQ
ncbi:ribonuclease III domain-containing protein [Peziza echinospora]|nr:ribonuclease III domain-containing protein [Peziza echinospora]